jgi:Zn finger protein HypA/HybF involved in hydrogenase expression
MSIATLKRKTQTKYNNMSVNTSTFSLNGTHRNQGYVGQTSMSRSIVRSLRNGSALRGYGGCCNNNTTPIVQTGSICMNDNTVVKSSSLSSKGMMDTRHCNSQCNVVKPDTNNNNNNQMYYINKKKLECINCSNPIVDENPTVSCCDECNITSNINITKPDEAYLTMSSSKRTEEINKACIGYDVIFVPYSVSKTPFAGFN